MTSSNPPPFRNDQPSGAFAQPSHSVNQYHDHHNQFASHAPPPFTIDQDMSNMDTFAASVHGAAGNTAVTDSVDDVEASHNTSAQPHSVSGQVIGMSTPGMGRPGPGSTHHQNSTQAPYSPSTPAHRVSVDDGNENVDPGLGLAGMSGGDHKRKRSKVSRACDECRRKKVRCDAAADDGTIKTCTNCQKNGTVCGYNRIPMKRGPSKGYIKELSERVQQVETQMALSNTPGTYRQSLDGNAVGPFADPIYSPDDNMSYKRGFSFSDQQQLRSPFANPEFQRDRMPSLGGWNPTGSPHPSATYRGGRDRGSVAIAPDQHGPITATTLSKPYWMNDNEINPRPAKRLKIDLQDNQLDALVVRTDVLSDYYQEFHANLPILPDADTSITIVQKASPKIRHAFVAAVSTLPQTKLSSPDAHVNGVSNGTSATTIFKTREDVEIFLWEEAAEAPELRGKEDNLVLLWTYLVLAVSVENDLSRLRRGRLSKGLLIKQAVDLGWACAQLEDKRCKDNTEQATPGTYVLYLARAWHCAGILARLHALAVGASNPIPLGIDTPLPIPRIAFPDALPFTVICNVMLSSVITLVQNDIPYIPYRPSIDNAARELVMCHLDDCRVAVPLDADSDALYQQIRSFYDLLTSRSARYRLQQEILQPAVDLAEALKKHTTASQEKQIYNPMRIHFFALTTITLLEFQQEGMDTTMSKIAVTGIDAVKTALEQISEREHVEDQLEVTHASSDIANGITASETGQDENPKPVHWADALLRMISDRAKPAAEENGTAANEGESGRAEASITLDFGALLKHGYLNVLAASAGC